MVGDGLHWSRVVGGAGRRGWRVLLVAGGSGYWFIVVWASSLAMFVSSSWVVVVVMLWWGRGLVLCFVVVSCQLPHGRLPSSCVASSSVVVTVLQSSVCVSSMTTNDNIDVIRRLVATSLSVMWHLFPSLKNGLGGGGCEHSPRRSLTSSSVIVVCLIVGNDEVAPASCVNRGGGEVRNETHL